MISDATYPSELQFKPSRIELDEAIEKAKASLLNDIKRSVYIYRCDLGGCNGCEIEIFSTITPVFDAERFGIKNTASPRHADILVCTGSVTRAMRLPALRAYEAAPDPKLVVAYGACGCSGGIFHDAYCTWGGVNELFPVDVYIPGCPPSPAQTIYGFAMALGKLGQKLHRVEESGNASVDGLLGHGIAYKVKTAIEREARACSGYAMGAELAKQFLDAVQGPGDAHGRASELIAAQDDARKAEVFSRLLGVLLEMSAESKAPSGDLDLAYEGVSAPLRKGSKLYASVAKGTLRHESAEAMRQFMADNPAKDE